LRTSCFEVNSTTMLPLLWDLRKTRLLILRPQLRTRATVVDQPEYGAVANISTTKISLYGLELFSTAHRKIVNSTIYMPRSYNAIAT
jgi:hypothetical protein